MLLLKSAIRHSHSAVFGLYSATPISPRVVCFLVAIFRSAASLSISVHGVRCPGWHFPALLLFRVVFFVFARPFLLLLFSRPSSAPSLWPGFLLLHLLFVLVPLGGVWLFVLCLYLLRLLVQLFAPCLRRVVGFLCFFFFSFCLLLHLFAVRVSALDYPAGAAAPSGCLSVLFLLRGC